jgi:hypothetical protein
MLTASERTKRWQIAHPERYAINVANSNARRKANGKSRSWQLKRKYGITLEQWFELFKKQGEKCAICERAYDANSKNWHVDHNHSTGKIRGILCHICNRIVLPVLEHYQPLISKARVYLEVNS